VNHPGISSMSTGTTATGRAAIQTNNAAIQLAGGAAVLEACIRIPSLPTVAEAFAYRIGFGDSVSADMTDGVYFELTQANANWQCATANNSTRTKVNSGVAAAANTFYRLRIEVNADGTQALLYIDSVLVATMTTNIPSGAGRQLGIVASIIKSAGVTSRTAEQDYIAAKIAFTAQR
jgi:protein involved in polysaccharide export with SLBB domain